MTRVPGTDLGGSQGRCHGSGPRVLDMEPLWEVVIKGTGQIALLGIGTDGPGWCTTSNLISPANLSLIPLVLTSPCNPFSPPHFSSRSVLSNSLINPQAPGWKAVPGPCKRELHPGTRPSPPSRPDVLKWATFCARVPPPTCGYPVSEVQPILLEFSTVVSSTLNLPPSLFTSVCPPQ